MFFGAWTYFFVVTSSVVKGNGAWALHIFAEVVDKFKLAYN